MGKKLNNKNNFVRIIFMLSIMVVLLFCCDSKNIFAQTADTKPDSLHAPLISITSVPGSLPKGGGILTFMYKLTNPDVVPLSDVKIRDDKCNNQYSYCHSFCQ